MMNINNVFDKAALELCCDNKISLGTLETAGGEGREEPGGGMTRTHNTERL